MDIPDILRDPLLQGVAVIASFVAGTFAVLLHTFPSLRDPLINLLRILLTNRLLMLVYTALVFLILGRMSVLPALLPASSPIASPGVPGPSPSAVASSPGASTAASSAARASSQPESTDGTILTAVRTRGYLNCGIEGTIKGFSYVDPGDPQQVTGFDADFCRVVAAAIFGEYQGKVTFVTLDNTQRFTELLNRNVDVVFRNTTWTVGRDASLGIDVGPTLFHDSQSIMVRNDIPGSTITTLAQLNDKKICVMPNTTTRANMDIELSRRDIRFTAVEARNGVQFRNNSEVFDAYFADNAPCDAVTGDRSSLISKRREARNPTLHTILEDSQIAREPLGPLFPAGDSQWRDVVTYAVLATIYAEELRIGRRADQATETRPVEFMLTTDNIAVKQFLGIDDESIKIHIGESMGIDKKFAFNIISKVGNYGEIYQRNLYELMRDFEKDSYGRGPNKVWNLGEGGVLSAPPFRTLDVDLAPLPTPLPRP